MHRLLLVQLFLGTIPEDNGCTDQVHEKVPSRTLVPNTHGTFSDDRNSEQDSHRFGTSPSILPPLRSGLVSKAHSSTCQHINYRTLHTKRKVNGNNKRSIYFPSFTQRRTKPSMCKEPMRDASKRTSMDQEFTAPPTLNAWPRNEIRRPQTKQHASYLPATVTSAPNILQNP